MSTVPDNVRARYGRGLIAAELGNLGRYVAVVDTIPWASCVDDLPVRPCHVERPVNLERDQLDVMVSRLPTHDAIVAMGGGMVLDAGKYLALRTGAAPMLVPSITSTDTPFSDSIALRTNGVPTGMLAEGQQTTVVVDFDLIQRADPRLNRAGYADLLAHDVALADWQAAVDQSRLPTNDAARSAIAEVMEHALAMAPEVGAATREGLEFLMRSYERLARIHHSYLGPPVPSGSEHLIAWNVEAVTGRHHIHGELVALGVVAASIAQGADDRRQRALDEARVRYRPTDLGVTWSELERALHTVDAYNQRARGFDSVLTGLTWTEGLLTKVRRAVEGPVSIADPH